MGVKMAGSMNDEDTTIIIIRRERRSRGAAAGPPAATATAAARAREELAWAALATRAARASSPSSTQLRSLSLPPPPPLPAGPLSARRPAPRARRRLAATWRRRARRRLMQLRAFGRAVWDAIRPPRPPAEAPLPESALLVAIAGRGGDVAPGDVMRFTGGSRAGAEALLCRLVARHGGDVQATGDGAVIYRFPGLGVSRFDLLRAWAARGAGGAAGARSSASLAHAVPPVWERREEAPPVVPREDKRDLMWAALALGASMAAVLHLSETLALDSGGGSLPGALALLLVSALAFAAPLMRLVARTRLRWRAARENGRRALLRAVLERPAGVALEAYALSHVWLSGAGHPIGPDALDAEIRALGGEPDVTAEGRVYFRFVDLDHEAAALARTRDRRRARA